MNEIEVRTERTVAIVTMNRPRQRNAMTLAMWREMGSLFETLGKDRSVRAIILTGAGGDFCTGADLSEFKDVRANAEQAAAYEAVVEACSDAIEAAPKPVVAALSGYCIGGGCALALACDFRIADRTVKIGIPAARLSIIYGVNGTRRLLALVGLATAKRIMFSAERFDADEGLRMGLIDGIAPLAITGANDFVATMAENAPLSIAGAKTILNDLATGSIDVGRIQQLMDDAAHSADYREGRLAFAEKRAPQFQGH